MNHNHLIIRAEVLTPPTSKTYIERWLVGLVKWLDMNIAAGPISSYVTKKGNRGLTSVVLIETSHIAIHIWDETNPALIQLDIYTCGKLVVEDAIKQLNVFEPTKIEYKFLDRENDLILASEGRVKHGSDWVETQLDNYRI